MPSVPSTGSRSRNRDLPFAATMPYSARCARSALTWAVRCRTRRWRARWSMRTLCASADLIGTKRMFGRVTASQIASGIGCVVLVALDVGLHVGRRHQPHLVPEGAEFAGPMVRRRARLDADKARMQTTE